MGIHYFSIPLLKKQEIDLKIPHMRPILPGAEVMEAHMA
jgi:hypothetical protein